MCLMIWGILIFRFNFRLNLWKKSQLKFIVCGIVALKKIQLLKNTRASNKQAKKSIFIRNVSIEFALILFENVLFIVNMHDARKKSWFYCGFSIIFWRNPNLTFCEYSVVFHICRIQSNTLWFQIKWKYFIFFSTNHIVLSFFF